MNQEKERIPLANGSDVEVDPTLLIESVDDAAMLLEAHIKILTATKAIIKRGISYGLKPDDAAAVAMELSRRAGKKAGESVHMEDEPNGNTNRNATKA